MELKTHKPFNLAVLAIDFETAVALRFLTGFGIAGVYPPGMKLVATRCEKDRGFGIGLLVGAITLGASLPHLLDALPGNSGMPWMLCVTDRPASPTSATSATCGNSTPCGSGYPCS